MSFWLLAEHCGNKDWILFSALSYSKTQCWWQYKQQAEKRALPQGCCLRCLHNVLIKAPTWFWAYSFCFSTKVTYLSECYLSTWASSKTKVNIRSKNRSGQEAFAWDCLPSPAETKEPSRGIEGVCRPQLLGLNNDKKLTQVGTYWYFKKKDSTL
jgi:hypothetical protein